MNYCQCHMRHSINGNITVLTVKQSKKSLIWQKQELEEKGGAEGDGGSYKGWLDEITHTGLLALAAESAGVMSHNTLQGPLGNKKRVNLKYQSFFRLVLPVIAPVPLLDSPVIHFLLPQRWEMNRKLGYCQALNGKPVALETQYRQERGSGFKMPLSLSVQSPACLIRLRKRGRVNGSATVKKQLSLRLRATFISLLSDCRIFTHSYSQLG